MRSEKFPALGIDLVEIKKADSFYKKNKSNLASFLRKDERDALRESSRPHETLAEILAAKEAVFKSGDGRWMGPRGFKKIPVLSLIKGPWKSLRVSVIKKNKYVVAYALGHY